MTAPSAARFQERRGEESCYHPLILPLLPLEALSPCFTLSRPPLRTRPAPPSPPRSTRTPRTLTRNDMESPAPEGKPTKGKGANKKEDKEGKNGKKSQRPSWSVRFNP